MSYPRKSLSRQRSGRLLVCIFAISQVVGTGPLALAETTYIPAVNLSERYDSNVFYAPKEFVPQGKQQWDLVSTLETRLDVLNKSRAGDTLLNVGVNGNAFAYNTYLAYVSTFVNASTDVSNYIREFVPGLTLRVSDLFLYTPQPPAFVTGKIAEGDVFARGVQGYRANTFINTLSTDAGYAISRSWSVQALYSYSIRRTGTFFVPGQPFTFFNTTVNNIGVGPTYQFDNGDTLFMKYNYVTSEQSPTTGTSPSITFNAHSFQPEYRTTIVRGWKATISGGATLVEEQQNKTFFSGRFMLQNDFDRRTRASISVSRQASPSYFGTGGALISNVAQVTIGHNFSRVIILTVNGNYAHNQTTSTPSFTIETINANAALDYKLTRSTKLTLSQEYGHFNYTNTPNFDRLATMLTLTTEWK